MMRRRDVISLLGGAAVANSLATLPFAASAQQANKIRNVAWLGVGRRTSRRLILNRCARACASSAGSKAAT